MKFHAGNDVIDFTKDTKGELAREGVIYQPRPEWESLPKVGTGSEFNRENREIARRKKFGFQPKKQVIDDLPWILTVKPGDEKKGEAGKDKQFRAKRSVSDNSSYFVFINNAEIGGFEAHALEDWYTFTPYRTYKTLTIEEAEEEFSKRHTILNKYSIMANRRKAAAGKEDEGEDTGKGAGEKTKKKSGAGAGAKKISDLNEWIEESNDEAENLSDDDERPEAKSDEEKEKKSARGKAARNDGDEENEMKVNEESDDGDHEGDEVDYSDSGEDLSADSDFEQTKNEEKYEAKGIDEEAGMKAMEEEEDEDDEDKELTEEGKEYKKLISQTLKGKFFFCKGPPLRFFNKNLQIFYFF
jgi:hypothetical protein